MIKKAQFLAEFFGTFWLVLGGCGVAIFASQNVGFFGVASAFGLSVFAMLYSFGPYSCGPFNPALSFGVFLNCLMPCKSFLFYFLAPDVNDTQIETENLQAGARDCLAKEHKPTDPTQI